MTSLLNHVLHPKKNRERLKKKRKSRLHLPRLQWESYRRQVGRGKHPTHFKNPQVQSNTTISLCNTVLTDVHSCSCVENNYFRGSGKPLSNRNIKGRKLIWSCHTSTSAGHIQRTNHVEVLIQNFHSIFPSGFFRLQGLQDTSSTLWAHRSAAGMLTSCQ